MNIVKLIFFLILCVTCSCTEVRPWQKEYLASPLMQWDPHPANSKFNQHMYQSKEGAFGGYGIAAGGCGCN